MHNEKNHSIKHDGGYVGQYGDIINMSCDAPEDGHEFCIKEPGGNTNQGPEGELIMMHHSRPVPSSVRVSKIPCFLQLSRIT